MRMHQKRTYWVEGYGDFPVDMLRYDEAQYATERDKEIAETQRNRRRVMLIGREPTLGRWQSFLWFPGQR